MSPFPPLVIGVVMVSKSRAGEKRAGEGDDDGLGFHVDSPGGGLEVGKV